MLSPLFSLQPCPEWRSGGATHCAQPREQLAVSCMQGLLTNMGSLHHTAPLGSGSWPTALAPHVRWLGLQPDFCSSLSAGHFRSSTMSSYICGWQKAAVLFAGPAGCLSSLCSPVSVLRGSRSPLLCGLPPFRWCSL